MDWKNALKCPRCNARGMMISEKSNDELLPQHGNVVCNQCGARFPFDDHILDLVQSGDSSLLTMAGMSNYLPMLPWIYENIWRPRSLTMLSGENFPVEREIKLLNDWLQVQSDELIVDLGSSTDLYARGIGMQNPGTTIFGIDMSIGMLKAGREYALRDGVNNIVHLRAPVQRLPFCDSSIDALMCGGSLNEFRSMSEALREARRVVKAGGRMFAMSLLAATRTPGKLAQFGAQMSGISFPPLDEFNRIVDASGWQCERQQVYGIVVFTLMKPKSRSMFI